MIQALLSVADVQARYGCCAKTAAKIIRSIDHIEHPRLMCPQIALEKREAAQMHKTVVVKAGRSIARRA